MIREEFCAGIGRGFFRPLRHHRDAEQGAIVKMVANDNNLFQSKACRRPIMEFWHDLFPDHPQSAS
jgi:hypothetical protein